MDYLTSVPPKIIRKPTFSDGFSLRAKFDWFSRNRFILDAKFTYSDKKPLEPGEI